MANRIARLLFGTVLSVVLVASAPRAQAYLLAYEGFDYPAGTDLTGAIANGGFGWTTPWGVNSSGTTIVGNALGDLASAGSLIYIDSNNRQLFASGGKGFFSGQAGTSQPFRDFLNPNAGNEGTIWLSFLAQRVGPTTNIAATPYNPYPRAGNFSLYEGNSERLAIGNSSGAPSNNIALIPAGSLSNLRPSTNDFSLLNLAVVRIDYGPTNNDTAYLFVNPGLGLEPNIANASATTSGMTNIWNFNFLRVRPFAGGTDTGNSRPYAELYVDEIRIGTTWQDVTPWITVVPEPSAVSLALVGGFLAWRVTRRRR